MTTWWTAPLPVAFSHEHLDALLLALASSTDNLTVGITVGIRRKALPHWANACISLCNAGGAWIAGHGGVWFSNAVASTNNESGNSSNSFPLYFSALAFGLLAFSEWKGYREEMDAAKGKKDDSTTTGNNDDGSMPSAKSMASFWSVLQLAIPMTLNNLAGGVAGGAAGLPPELSAMYALLSSFLTMWVGHRIGCRLGAAMTQGTKTKQSRLGFRSAWLHPSFLSALLLAMLSFLTLKEALFG